METNESDKGLAAPHPVAALWFVCRCFGIGVKELNQRMQVLRARDKNSTENYPAAIWRETIDRAVEGTGPWRDVLASLCNEAIYDQLRRKDGQALFCFT